MCARARVCACMCVYYIVLINAKFLPSNGARAVRSIAGVSVATVSGLYGNV